MGHAQHHDDPYVSQAPHSRCLDSAFCVLPPTVARVFAGRDGLWLHYGPIGTALTPLAFHRGERLPLDRNHGHLDTETSPVDRVFAGCHLDLYCLEQAPGAGARRHVQSLGFGRATLWCVYAVAWRAAGPLHVTWKPPGFGLPNEGYSQYSGLVRPGAAALAEQSTLIDLLAGDGARRGRPPRWRDPSWRKPTERAIAIKVAHPGLPWVSIADAVGMNLSTLRECRRMLRREQTSGHDLHVLEGGDH